ncbi:MAG: hypothetical protein L6Q95_10450, partial [Planctomycetes bacterium]|nr:hypothetical protein [Planctomycetota bacterium]
RYGDTALARPGRRGLARNALAVLGEAASADVREAALRDPSRLVRAQAATTTPGASGADRTS